VVDRRGYITDKNRGLEILRSTGPQASSLPGRTANAARQLRSQGAATLTAKHGPLYAVLLVVVEVMGSVRRVSP
jgi:hypothetical protein